MSTDEALWAAVADLSRRAVIDALLSRGEATASALARELPITRQAVAKHLAVLARAGLVERRREGREVRFAVRAERLGTAARALAGVAAEWDARLAAMKRRPEAVRRITWEGTPPA